MIDLVRRLIEHLRQWLREPDRPQPLALSPPARVSAYDDRFGYAQEMKLCESSDASHRSITTEPNSRTPSTTPSPSIRAALSPATSSEPSAEQPAPSGAPETETASPAAAASPSRKARRKAASEFRKLEKARMKFDKWVTPQGAPAEKEKVQRAAPKPKAPKPETVEPEPEPETGFDLTGKTANVGIADHYDLDPNNPEVLYEETELWGQYNFRDTILDQLERYWWYLERMKARDPDAYGFYKTYGAQLVPYLTNKLVGKAKKKSDKLVGKELEKYRSEITLSPMFNEMRPAFGCVVFGANPKVESWEEGNKIMWPRFIYYTKMDRPPPETQLMLGGDTYKCTLWWDSPKRAKKWGTPQQFCIFIDRSGQHIQVLRTCETRMIHIHKKKGLGLFDIPDRHWRIPGDYEEWAAEFGIDAQTHLSHTFCSVVEHAEHAHFGDVRVQVHKDDMTAVFAIDSRRLSYFFRDRDYDEDGRRRVFHIVRPHVRADGSTVKMHYRGEKSFTWAGYRVEITVPALDHFMDEDFGVGSSDAFWIHHKKKYLTEPEVAAKLVGWQHQGYGGHQRS